MFAVSFDGRDRHIEDAYALESCFSQFAVFAFIISFMLLPVQISRSCEPFFFFCLFCLPFSFPPLDRVVDDLNPVLTFTRREVESLLHFVEEEPDPSQVQLQPQDSMESVLRTALHLYPHLITKVDEWRRLRRKTLSLYAS